MSLEVEATNLGPIPELTFQCEDYGVTVLTAPNGSGKSILLDAVSAAAKGKGRLPLRDGSKKGRVGVGGASITIGASTRHTGSFVVEHLEGKFSLSELVDPGIKTPASADNHRIKALVLLTGVEADAGLFRADEAFAEFDNVINMTGLPTTDLVAMSQFVKRTYEAKSREAEDMARDESAKANLLAEQIASVDTGVEKDEDTLNDARDAARDELTKLQERQEQWHTLETNMVEARQTLADAVEKYDGPTAAEVQKQIDEADEQIRLLNVTRESLHKQLQDLDVKIADAGRERDQLDADYHHAEVHERLVTGCEDAIEKNRSADIVTAEEIKAAEAKVEQATRAIELGTLARDAMDKQGQMNAHRQQAKVADELGQKFRAAAAHTEQILSDAIQCDSLRIVAVEGKARLVVPSHKRGPDTPFHDLSEGERWRIAIDLGADVVGEGGLLVIEQDAWEGLDERNRAAVHLHARSRKVYILTAEATHDFEHDGDQMIAKPYEARNDAVSQNQ